MIHPVANYKYSSFFMAEQYSSVCVCVYHIFFILSSLDGYLGSFHLLVIVNNAVMNNREHVFFFN